jgi:hypothetical protein
MELKQRNKCKLTLGKKGTELLREITSTATITVHSKPNSKSNAANNTLTLKNIQYNITLISVI